MIAMSGSYDIRGYYHGDHYDDNVYFNNPVDFLPNASDPWYLDQYRNDIFRVFGAGEHDICLEENRRISQIFHAKGIPHWFDYWGLGATNDWPLRLVMAKKLFM